MAKAATTEKTPRTMVKKLDGVFALFSDGTIRLDNIQFSYPHVGTPQEGKDDDGNTTLTYGAIALLPKTTHKPAMDVCLAAIKRMEAEKTKDPKKPFKYPAAKRFIKNGDALDEDGERIHPPEVAGHWFVSARERNRPRLRGPDLDPKTGKVRRLTPEQADQMFYGGCYGTMIIRPWAMDNKYGKRVNAGLVAVQFIRDGEAFGEGRISDDDVDDSLDGVSSDGDDWSGDDDGEDIGL